jgi:hypothetical protein
VGIYRVESRRAQFSLHQSVRTMVGKKQLYGVTGCSKQNTRLMCVLISPIIQGEWFALEVELYEAGAYSLLYLQRGVGEVACDGNYTAEAVSAPVIASLLEFFNVYPFLSEIFCPTGFPSTRSLHVQTLQLTLPPNLPPIHHNRLPINMARRP